MTRLTIPTLAPLGYIPTRKHKNDAGADIRYCGELPIILGPFERKVLPTGVHLEIPPGYVGLLCPRSGLAAKFGITQLNSPGVIDSGYTGEIRCPLINLGDIAVKIDPGDRIAQLLIVPIATAHFEEALALGETERGAAGLGSTGVK